MASREGQQSPAARQRRNILDRAINDLDIMTQKTNGNRPPGIGLGGEGEIYVRFGLDSREHDNRLCSESLSRGEHFDLDGVLDGELDQLCSDLAASGPVIRQRFHNLE